MVVRQGGKESSAGQYTVPSKRSRIMSMWPVTARPTRQVRPTIVPLRLRMALILCSVPCTPAYAQHKGETPLRSPHAVFDGKAHATATRVQAQLLTLAAITMFPQEINIPINGALLLSTRLLQALRGQPGQLTCPVVAAKLAHSGLCVLQVLPQDLACTPSTVSTRTRVPEGHVYRWTLPRASSPVLPSSTPHR